MTIKVTDLFIKKSKGVAPKNVDRIVLTQNAGVNGDIFATGGDRQVSLLLSQTAREISVMFSKEACLKKFSCNIIIEGCELSQIKQGDILSFAGASLEITSVGKKCHALCELASCPLIIGAIFAKVLRGGEINVEDTALCERNGHNYE